MRINGAQTANMENVWYSGDFTGDQMPTARCTIHKGNVRLTGGGGYGDFASIIFSVGAQQVDGIYTYFPREIPSVKSVTWNRDTGTSVATATITLYNTRWNPSTGDLEPGYFTWNRGSDSFSKARGIAKNAWYGMLVPDNIIRTFEGYGADFTVGPEQDSHLVCTGNWIIDKVVFKEGLITLSCSDLGRILVDQILFPPIVPRSSPIPGMQYPVQFSSYITVPYSQSEKYTPLFMAFDDSSSTPYTGPNGYQAGHYAYQACDGNGDTFWLSIGNGAPNSDFSYEWVQARIGGETIGAVNVHALYANMQGYVSVYQDGYGWMGSDTIPYNPADPVSAPNGSNIPYVARFTSSGLNQMVEFPLIAKATHVRVTFTNLQDSGIGPYVYRAGMREFGAMAAKTLPQGYRIAKDAGFNYSDYCADTETEILTRRGWLRYDEVVEGDEALAIDPDTGIADWQIIESVFRKHRHREMVSMESQLHSSLTTPDHRWLVTDQQGRRMWRTTETLKTGHRIPLAAPVVAPIVAKHADDFVELTAWFWTEGWYGETTNACIAQSEVANPVHTARIRGLLRRLYGEPGRMMRGRGAMWNESQRVDGVVTFRLSKPVKDALLEVAPEKVLAPDFLTSLTASQLELLIERSLDADGWRTTRGRVGLSQRDERRAKAFEMACVLAGRPVRTRLDFNGMWSVNLMRTQATLPQSAKVERVDYDGVIWCPTLRHHNWLARRHGTVYYTGNTDLVKLFCVWGGFHWPKPSDQPFIAVSKAPGFPNGLAFELFAKPPNDAYLKNGRVWGDLEQTGTYGVVPLTIDQFDKKTLMDGITLVQQTVNFLFMIDESGGVVWRFPNYKERGNRVEGTGQRIQRFIRILDTQTLQDVGVTLDGGNARERNYVASPDGRFVGGARGYNLNPIGLRRVLGYIDKNFGSNKECQTMANFISIAQMMSYRTLDVTIAGLPTIQIDDQVEVVDTASGEGYLHYIKSIVSTLDMSAGSYTYELTTSWLGARAGTEWAFNQYGNLSADLTYLLDYYDTYRSDGAYNSFKPVVIPIQVDVADITTSPASPVGPGANVHIVAVMSPNNVAGKVQFIRDGVRALGSPQPVDTNTGLAALTINSNVIGSGARLGAYFIPAPGSNFNAASTDIPFVVT